MEAVLAAPGSHRVVFENERTRVLEVSIAAGEREPEHTHRWPSVMAGSPQVLQVAGSGDRDPGRPGRQPRR